MESKSFLEKSAKRKNLSERKINVKKQATLDKFKIKTSITDKELPSLESNKTISIFSWNVNGIRAISKKDNFKDFFEKEDPDIICLNETKIDEDNLMKEGFNRLYNNKYKSYWNTSKTKSGYSGVAVFTKFIPEKVIYGIDHSSHDGEGRVITLEFPQFYLIAVYVPNSGEGLKRLSYRIEEWDYEFFNYIQNLRKKKHIIIAGDLNVAHKDIDIFDPKSKNKSPGFTPEERESFGKFLEKGYIDTFRHFYPDTVKYTYFSLRAGRRNLERGWRLDYFVIDKEFINNVEDSIILDEIEGSDHCPIKLILKT